MARYDFDFCIVGAGSAGLVAADFAVHLGVRVALVEAEDIGGDCTWTGCVPSKALVKAARVAHLVRRAGEWGINAGAPDIDMSKVRASIIRAVQKVYQRETPDILEARGIKVIKGAARFADPHTIDVSGRRVTARKFLIATGAGPALPDIDGLDGVPHATYQTIFDNERLPGHMLVIGGGPVGVEIAQAYSRLGADVTIVAPTLLPREDAETRAVIEAVFRREGIRCHFGRAASVRANGDEITLTDDADQEVRGDLLFVATGRRPNLENLGLETAGVTHTASGIPVDRRMRTNVASIHAAGDVVGGPQFTHFAGWQGFHAARAALLPGGGATNDLVPRVTFTDPEVAHVGPDLATCKRLYGDGVATRRMELSASDRAIADGEEDGFLRLIVRPNGAIVAATVVAPHAGETLGELVVAIANRVHADALADTLHAYPTYATGLQQLAVDIAMDKALGGFTGKLARWLAGARTPDVDSQGLHPTPAREGGE